MVPRLALHEVEVIIDEDHPHHVVVGGLAARRGLAKLIADGRVVASLEYSSIDDLVPDRIYRVVGVDGRDWLVRRAGGCGCGTELAAWPGPQ